VCAAQRLERRVAKIVGGGCLVGVAGAGKDEEIGWGGHQQFEWHLAVAAQGVVAREVAEAGGGERGVGETAGSRDCTSDLVDEGARRGAVQRAAEGSQAAIERVEHGLATLSLADGGGDAANRGAHTLEILRQRHGDDIALEPAQQGDGGGDAERSCQHQVGIVAQHVLGGAVRDGNALGLIGDGGDGGVPRQVGDRGNALTRRQLDQELVGTQIERDNALRFILGQASRGPQRQGKAERCGERPSVRLVSPFAPVFRGPQRQGKAERCGERPSVRLVSPFAPVFTGSGSK
jgi:hypothetical protein